MGVIKSVASLFSVFNLVTVIFIANNCISVHSVCFFSFSANGPYCQCQLCEKKREKVKNGWVWQMLK